MWVYYDRMREENVVFFEFEFGGRVFAVVGGGDNGRVSFMMSFCWYRGCDNRRVVLKRRFLPLS